MIGEIRVAVDVLSAKLDDEGVWRSPDSDFESLLREHFEPHRYGPDHGQFGRAAVVEAAEWFGAEYEVLDEDEPSDAEDGEEVEY